MTCKEDKHIIKLLTKVTWEKCFMVAGFYCNVGKIYGLLLNKIKTNVYLCIGMLLLFCGNASLLWRTLLQRPSGFKYTHSC